MDLRRIGIFFILVMVVALGAVDARAQYLGTVNAQTNYVPVFTQITAPAASAIGIIPNLGQSTHFVNYCRASGGGSITSIVLELEATFDGSNWFPVSPSLSAIPNACSVSLTANPQIIASGYFAALRVNVLTLTVSGGGTLNVFYSSVGAPTTSVNPWDGAISTALTVNSTDRGLSDGIVNTDFGVWRAEIIGGAKSSQILPAAAPTGYNGSTWDRIHTASLANFPTSSTTTARNVIGSNLVEHNGRWSVNSAPSAGNQASASIAGESNVEHVLDKVCWSAGSTTAPALTSLQVNIRDGATGAGTVLMSFEIEIPATTGEDVAPFCTGELDLVGTAGTAMTAEWSAGLSNLRQTVTLVGYNVN